MHRSALCLRSPYQSRLPYYFCYIHVRRLSSAGFVPVANSDQQAIETLEPWQDSDGKTLAINEKDLKDIFVHDLSATLEAHRASNRAAVIRKTPIDGATSPPFKRLSVQKDSGRGGKVKDKSAHKRLRICQLWPANTVQAKELYGRKGTKGFVKKDDELDYIGTAFSPGRPWNHDLGLEHSQMQRPWLAYIRTTSDDKLEHLTNEIKAYEAYMRLSPREEAASELVISDVNSVAQNKPKIRTLSLLGSRSTGLATPTSDFDFSLTETVSLPGGWIIPSSEDSVSQSLSSRRQIKRKAVKALKELRRHFQSSKMFRNTGLVEYARVPIIRSTHVATGLDVQIQTMARYQDSREHTIAYLSEFPSLRPLYIMLRYCLEMRDLTTVYEGGLGSYTLLMMIVTALKHSSGKFAPNDLGGQLLHVLDFYSKADLYKVGFSINPPRIFKKRKGRVSLATREAHFDNPQLNGIDKMQNFYPRKPYLLCLQDPANDLNDLGKNAYGIKHIQATFYQAQKDIRDILNGKTKLEKGKIPTHLNHLVRADYRAFEVRRSRIERCADPAGSDDLDYSEQRIRRDQERRMNRNKVDVEKDDNQRPVRTRHGKARIRTRIIPRLRPRPGEPVEMVIVAKKRVETQKLLGTNDDNSGPNSPESRPPLASFSVRNCLVRRPVLRYVLNDTPLDPFVRHRLQELAARPSHDPDDEGPPGLVQNVTVGDHHHLVSEHFRKCASKRPVLPRARRKARQPKNRVSGRARVRARTKTTKTTLPHGGRKQKAGNPRLPTAAPRRTTGAGPSLAARPSRLPPRHAAGGGGGGGRRRAYAGTIAQRVESDGAFIPPRGSKAGDAVPVG